MMKVISLKWLSKEAKEAELLISDGKYNCVVFSHPCEVSEGEIIEDPLHVFMAKDLMICSEKDYFVTPIKTGSLAQKCIAQVVNKNEGLIQIGNINIILEEILPAGVEEGDFIEFTCSRLDLW